MKRKNSAQVLALLVIAFGAISIGAYTNYGSQGGAITFTTITGTTINATLLDANTGIFDGLSVVNETATQTLVVTAGASLNTSLVVGSTLTLSTDGPLVVGTAVTPADFANALAVFSTGETNKTDTAVIGVATEVVTTAALDAMGFRGQAMALVAPFGLGMDAYGLYGTAFAASSGDTAIIVGVRGISNESHSGGNNIGVWGTADNGANDYSFYGDLGLMYNVDNIQTEGVIDVVRTPTGDGSADKVLIRMSDGSTVPLSIKWDHAMTRVEVGDELNATVLSAGEGVFTTTSTSNLRPAIASFDMTISTRSDSAEHVLRGLGDYEIFRLTSAGVMILAGGSTPGSVGSAQFQDDTTLYGTIDFDGDTMQITNNKGAEIEFGDTLVLLSGNTGRLMVHAVEPASALAVGASGATFTETGAFLTINLSDPAHFAYGNFEVEEGWDGGTIGIDVYVGLAGAETNSDLIHASLRVDSTAEEHGTLSGATTNTHSIDHNISTFSSALDTHELNFQLVPANLTAGNQIGLRFWLDDVTTSTPVAGVEVIQFSIKYRTKYINPSALGGFPSEG